MTRKDYQLIAASFVAAHAKVDELRHKAHDKSSAHEAVDWAALILCDKLAADNPRFDRNRFLHAAGFWTKRD